MSEVKWTNEQLNAIKEDRNNVLVAAAAGSGKTAVLVERIINKIINKNNLTNRQKRAIDANADGFIDINDKTTIDNYLDYYIDKLPYTQKDK